MPKILIADDDPDVRDLAAFKLEQAGFDVVGVDNGLAALSAVRDDEPDLIVLDVMMPGMSGIDVCRELRTGAHTSRLPVILLTTRAQEGDIEVGFAAGADDYLVKPFRPRELVSRVEAVLMRMGA
jgi:DNA-binding response OmpR family regulator